MSKFWWIIVLFSWLVAPSTSFFSSTLLGKFSNSNEFKDEISDHEFIKWQNETASGEWKEGRILKEEDTSNTRRMCVRALDQLFNGVFKMRIPKSKREVFVPCMSCNPTRYKHTHTHTHHICDYCYCLLLTIKNKIC
jgi:hypothetical protein